MAPSVSKFRITSHLLCWASEGGATTNYPMPFTWASHIATSVLTGRYTLPSQSLPMLYDIMDVLAWFTTTSDQSHLPCHDVIPGSDWLSW